MTVQPNPAAESIPTAPSSQPPAGQRTSFDESTAESASAESSLALARFDEAYQARPPWDIDGPQPEFARLLDQGLVRGRVLDLGLDRSSAPEGMRPGRKVRGGN
jgi:hypothetical protein